MSSISLYWDSRTITWVGFIHSQSTHTPCLHTITLVTVEPCAGSAAIMVHQQPIGSIRDIAHYYCAALYRIASRASYYGLLVVSFLGSISVNDFVFSFCEYFI